MFDRDTGFFRGREPDGEFRPIDEVDPHTWGRDYTEMSAWYLWVASGLYPLSIGSGDYVITAPMVPRICWPLEGDVRLEITAPDAGPAIPTSSGCGLTVWSGARSPCPASG